MSTSKARKGLKTRNNHKQAGCRDSRGESPDGQVIPEQKEKEKKFNPET